MPRPIEDQVVVITGASSGIGRETALLVGERRAGVVLAARNETALAEVAGEIERRGGRAQVVVTDVGDWEQVERLAREAISRFGRIDTWVNNAGVSVYGRVEDLTLHDIERVIHVDLLGTIYGIKAALPFMIQQGEGTIVNVSSGLGRRAVPLQAPYSAAKHGIIGFADALRMELERDHPGISVTTIMPASVNTPFFAHARSRMGVRPKPLPPVYEPRDVAAAIVSAAETPQRDVYVGSAAKTIAALHAFSPALTDRLMLTGNLAFTMQQDDGAPVEQTGILDEPSLGPGASTGAWGSQAHPSAYTRAFEIQHPTTKRLLTLTLGAGALLLLNHVRNGHNGHRPEHWIDASAWPDNQRLSAWNPQPGYEEMWGYAPPAEPGYGPSIH